VVCALRSAHPDLLVVLGGPGMPRRSRTLGLLTDDVEEMLAAIAGRDAVLTHREREVMTAVAEGLTNLEIAARMGVSASTVKTHLDRVFLKTGTVHRAAAVAHALRHGWIA
jgi:DNA-binding CsgD family transcriptional regulator